MVWEDLAASLPEVGSSVAATCLLGGLFALWRVVRGLDSFEVTGKGYLLRWNRKPPP